MGKIWSKLPEETQAESLAKEPGKLQLLFEEIVKVFLLPKLILLNLLKCKFLHRYIDSYKGVYAIGKVYSGQS
jgi:hypothetical protein